MRTHLIGSNNDHEYDTYALDCNNNEFRGGPVLISVSLTFKMVLIPKNYFLVSFACSQYSRTNELLMGTILVLIYLARYLANRYLVV